MREGACFATCKRWATGTEWGLLPCLSFFWHGLYVNIHALQFGMLADKKRFALAGQGEPKDFEVWKKECTVTGLAKFARTVADYYIDNDGFFAELLLIGLLGGSNEVLVQVATHEVDGATAEAATHDA